MAMSSPDMDVIKEIPGYKVILKAILKSQIQQLVEQLACNTDEESVILTASVADGTLCHLGSNSGKSFLEDHEDIKSQFLGFCLKRHHSEKRDKERKEAEEREAQTRGIQNVTSPPFGNMGPGMGYMSPHMSPRFSSPRQRGPNTRMKSPGSRHQPYPPTRPMRHPGVPNSLQQGSPGQGPGPNPVGPVIKSEPLNENENSNSLSGDPSHNVSGANSDSSQPASPFAGGGSSTEHKPDSSSSNDNPGFDLNNSSSVSTSDLLTNAGLDPNVTVKVEAMANNDMDLEITGVELGQHVSNQDWSNVQNLGQAAGTSGDMTEQGYSSSIHDSQSYESKRKQRVSSNVQPPGGLECDVCGKVLPCNAQLVIHYRVHTGEKPYVCHVCKKAFAQKNNMKSHMLVHAMPPTYL